MEMDHYVRNARTKTHNTVEGVTTLDSEGNPETREITHQEFIVAAGEVQKSTETPVFNPYTLRIPDELVPALDAFFQTLGDEPEKPGLPNHLVDQASARWSKETQAMEDAKKV